jgi:lipoprotein-anchoring transpeptidase ErfK/SrfK
MRITGKVSTMRLIVSLLFFLGFLNAAQADVRVVVNRATQTLTATIDGTVHVWPVSTGKRGHSTPGGVFGVQSMDADHYSSLYDWAPMPHSIFFNGDVAFHGTDDVNNLGRPVSHGCVRLHRKNAAFLFAAVQRSGRRAHIQVL